MLTLLTYVLLQGFPPRPCRYIDVDKHYLPCSYHVLCPPQQHYHPKDQLYTPRNDDKAVPRPGDGVCHYDSNDNPAKAPEKPIV